MRTVRRSPRPWSRYATQGNGTLDLEPGVFTLTDPRRIAKSLKRSADRSLRRHPAAAYSSAMSLLTRYIARSGKLAPRRRARLEAAKDELRVIYNRPRRNAKRVRAMKSRE